MQLVNENSSDPQHSGLFCRQNQSSLTHWHDNHPVTVDLGRQAPIKCRPASSAYALRTQSLQLCAPDAAWLSREDKAPKAGLEHARADFAVDGLADL